MKNRRGLTLLELLIVVAVITIAAALILPTVLTATGNVKAALSAPVVLP
jgi:prepilin-type N-terminal cleavage/methylation domain-containing protein